MTPLQNARLLAAALLLLLAAALPLASPTQAQDLPPQRQIRGFIPPDQLVSFRSETPFSQFIDFLNPIFERVTGKLVVDPAERVGPIGVALQGVYYMDALELVLDYNDLTFRETDRYFIIEDLPDDVAVQVDLPGGQLAATPEVPATLDTREIEINAVLFSVNRSRARDLGIDWNVFFGGETASGGGGGDGGGSNGGGSDEEGLGGTTPRFFVKTDDLADAVDDYLLMPDQFNVATLTRLFRVLENEGAGETIANPSISVQSGEKGRIQIGTDFPFVTRDFSGNSVVQFVSTGIIVEVTPTLLSEAIVDTVGAPEMDFIHLNVQVENSNGQISGAGPIVDRSTANTQVLLLDGEQTVIGGLYTTDETVSRRGIPILKDLPWWFFGIRYLTGVTQTTKVQRELVILLQARLVDQLQARAARPLEGELLERWRRQVEQRIKNASAECDPSFGEVCEGSQR
ncbi:MAG: type II and III secretion system protein [Rhodothermales bacterium]|nr:type II and III secretion system protein [Rhodothermales bacterium]